MRIFEQHRAPSLSLVYLQKTKDIFSQYFAYIGNTLIIIYIFEIHLNIITIFHISEVFEILSVTFGPWSCIQLNTLSFSFLNWKKKIWNSYFHLRVKNWNCWVVYESCSILNLMENPVNNSRNHDSSMFNVHAHDVQSITMIFLSLSDGDDEVLLNRIHRYIKAVLSYRRRGVVGACTR